MDTRRTVRVARRLAVVALVLILVVPTAALGADVTGSPDISLYATNNQLSPGETTALQVSVVNTGDVQFGSLQNPALTQEVTTARGTTLNMRSGDAPVEIESGTVGLGSVPQGSIPATFQVSVDEDAEPGTYRLPVTVEYTYTSGIGDNGAYFENEVKADKYVRIRITEASRFEVVSVDTDAAVGGSGQVDVTLRNDGDALAEDASRSDRPVPPRRSSVTGRPARRGRSPSARPSPRTPPSAHSRSPPRCRGPTTGCRPRRT